MVMSKMSMAEQMPETQRLTAAQIKALEAALAKGDRVEIIPQRDGVKILRVRRDEIKA